MSPSRFQALAAVLALSVVCISGCGSNSSDAAPTNSLPAANMSAQLASVVADANRMAPALESKLRGTPYPTTVAGARAALATAGIVATAGNAVDGYRYDPKDVEFRLCIQGPTGAFAVYDTRPMSLFRTGETGGCPTLSG